MRNAFVFDMDGLMVNSEPLSRAAWERVLSSFGHTMPDDIYQDMIGLRIDRSAEMVMEAFDLSLGTEELIARKNANYLELLKEGIPVMPGLYELVSALRKASISWGVATSSARAHAEHILRSLGLWSECSALAGGDEVTHGKPAPDLYLLAAERLGVEPTRCIALDDSVPGCTSAESAGMLVIAIPNGDTISAEFPSTARIYPSLMAVRDQLPHLLNQLA